MQTIKLKLLETIYSQEKSHEYSKGCSINFNVVVKRIKVSSFYILDTRSDRIKHTCHF